MARRETRWISDDGKEFPTKRDVDAYESFQADLKDFEPIYTTDIQGGRVDALDFEDYLRAGDISRVDTVLNIAKYIKAQKA